MALEQNPPRTAGRPTAAICMMPTVFEAHFDLERLARSADLLAPPLVEDLESPALADVNVLFTGWGTPPLTPEVLDRMPNLRWVMHCAGSVRPLHPEHLLARGIRLFSAADQNARPVAQYTLAAILWTGKRAWQLVRGVEAADFTNLISDQELGNSRRTIGVLGFSRVGQQVTALLQTVMSARVLVADPYVDPADVAAAGASLVDFDTLLQECDVLTIHAPATEETRHMVDARALALLRDGATVVNTARGSLLDHDALAAECATGRLSAILDVTDPEPLPAESPLRHLPNVVLTPHIAGSLGNEVTDLCDSAIDDLESVLRGLEPDSRIQPAVLTISA